MKIKDSVAFVTGANRGLGLALVHELLARGASKVYAGVRDPASINLPGVIAVKLDVTNAEEVAAAAAQCGDVTLLINNAGIARFVSYLDPAAIDTAREIMDANYLGPIRMCQAFTPVLANNHGGAIINILSVASWLTRRNCHYMRRRSLLCGASPTACVRTCALTVRRYWVCTSASWIPI